MIEAFEEVPAAESPQRIGQSWDENEHFRKSLRGLLNSSTSTAITVNLPKSLVQVIYRSLREAMAEQGEGEFETRTEYCWEDTQHGFERLKQMASPIKNNS